MGCVCVERNGLRWNMGEGKVATCACMVVFFDAWKSRGIVVQWIFFFFPYVLVSRVGFFFRHVSVKCPGDLVLGFFWCIFFLLLHGD